MDGIPKQTVLRETLIDRPLQQGALAQVALVLEVLYNYDLKSVPWKYLSLKAP
jgi:hypothetical protein